MFGKVRFIYALSGMFQSKFVVIYVVISMV
jgi:hypothetical protein